MSAIVKRQDNYYWFSPILGYEHYCSLRNQVLKLVPLPDLVVYLNAVPQECYNRIARRGRVIICILCILVFVLWCLS